MKLGSCSLTLQEPRLIGIVNNTPDSFSGDGCGGDVERAARMGFDLFEEGADIVDVGGESTRPGADPVTIKVELERTIPVVEMLARRHSNMISIDTMKPEVAQSALLAGATIVNDVSGLRNPKMIEVVAEYDAAVIIMHMLGEPRDMQVRPVYKDVVREVRSYLEDRIAAAEKCGVSPRKILVDPGIGFGKTLVHNIELLADLGELKSLGKPIVVGVSRKSFIGRITGAPEDKRLEGSIAAGLLAVRNGANILRVHDVLETARALKVAMAIWSAE
ncbi:MAG TPA: dihydropteroate synthase [Thermoplasmata archaeon]